MMPAIRGLLGRRRRLLLLCAALLVLTSAGGLWLIMEPESPESLEAKAMPGFCQTLGELVSMRPAKASDQAFYDRLKGLSETLAEQAPERLQGPARDYEQGIDQLVEVVAAAGYSMEKVKPEDRAKVQSSAMTTASLVLMKASREDCGQFATPAPKPSPSPSGEIKPLEPSNVPLSGSPSLGNGS